MPVCRICYCKNPRPFNGQVVRAVFPYTILNVNIRKRTIFIDFQWILRDIIMQLIIAYSEISISAFAVRAISVF